MSVSLQLPDDLVPFVDEPVQHFDNVKHLDDEQLLRIMAICDQYARQQKLLAEKLSTGIFQLLQARKNGSISVEDIRQDFDPSLHLEDDDEGGSMKLIEIDEGMTTDTLLMFSALPPPALRRAQKTFIDSLKIALDLISTIHELELETH
jgi:hypothetical protein